MTDYLEDELLDHIFGTGPWTAPGTLYVALLQSASADDDDVVTNAAKEIQSGTFPVNGYERKSIAVGTSSGGAVSNTAQISFGPATQDWPAATHAWLIDNALVNQGEILFHGALGATKDAGVNDTIVFAIGEIDITLD